MDYYESMNTVLCQELVRFNRLIVTIHTSLTQLQKALRGMDLSVALAGCSDSSSLVNCFCVAVRVCNTTACFISTWI